MITTEYLADKPKVRASLETLLAESLPGNESRGHGSDGFVLLAELLDMEHAGLVEYDAHSNTENVTAEGLRVVVEFAHTDALIEDAARRAALRASSGRHALKPGAESTLPSLGIVVASSRTDETEVIPPVVAEPEWPTESGELDDPFTVPVDFLGGFEEAAVAHTAELEAIAVDVPPLRRFGRWVARNLTGTRVTILAATIGVLVGTGIGWWLA